MDDDERTREERGWVEEEFREVSFHQRDNSLFRGPCLLTLQPMMLMMQSNVSNGISDGGQLKSSIKFSKIRVAK
jgi:hypothetical protein